MKNYIRGLLTIMMAVFMSYNLIACGDDDDIVEDKFGSIYGIVTELGTAEPMRAIGVELYKSDNLLLKTVTFDDGHFEFKDLNPGSYRVKVVADEYEQTEEGSVTVETGRQARIDLQVRKQDIHAKAYTANATVSGNQVTLNGEYTKDYNYSVSEAGFVYATNNNPQNGGTKVKCKKDEIKEVNSTYKLSTTISDLSRGTYYYQAYATTSYGTAYGEILSFKLSITPVVTTLTPTNILAETATLNGQIEAEGDPAYTERGFVYSKSYKMPTVDDPANATTKVPVSGKTKSFSANVSSLVENATYYVRAYATNEDGTFYGEMKTFSPSAVLPIVTTLEITNILPTSAIMNGRIDNPGEPTYTERGFLYSSSYKNPTISAPSTATTKVVVDGTSKEFSANISSLKEGTTYYARAYALSSRGTSYGEVITFKPEHPDYVVISNLMVQKEDLARKVSWASANSLCKASRVAGYSDWRLPTIDELATMYGARNEIPNLVTTGYYDYNYWSSSYYYGKDTYTNEEYYFYYYLCFGTGNKYSTHYTEPGPNYGSSNNARAVRTIK